MHGNLFVANINHEDSVRQSSHGLNSTKAALQLLALPASVQNFLLGQFAEAAVLLHRVEVFKPLDGLLDCLEVGQRAAEPAVGNMGHAAARGLGLHGVLGGPLSPHEQDTATIRRE